MKRTIGEYFDDFKNGPYVTYILLFVTLIMYLILSINGGSENIGTLIQYGAKVNEYIYIGEWWRLLTPIFLHIGFAHLIFNSLVVYFLGSEIEMIIGHFRYFLLYMLSGLMGNLASFALNNSISAGASTAIFGIFASTIVLAKFYPYHTGIQLLSRNYAMLILLNVVFGFFSTTVDNAGHIGGLVGGYLIMYVLSAKNALNNPKKKRILHGIAYLIAVILLFLVGYFRIEFQYIR